MVPERAYTTETSRIWPLPFAIQLENILLAEIVARRFPVETDEDPHVDLKITGISVDTQRIRAQAILEVHVGFTKEPRPYEISFKLVGLFTYPPEHNIAEVRTFLDRGSLSVLLPFARELLLSLCSRLQAPPVMISLLAVAPSTTETKTEQTPQ